MPETSLRSVVAATSAFEMAHMAEEPTVWPTRTMQRSSGRETLAAPTFWILSAASLALVPTVIVPPLLLIRVSCLPATQPSMVVIVSALSVRTMTPESTDGSSVTAVVMDSDSVVWASAAAAPHSTPSAIQPLSTWVEPLM